MSTYFVGGHDGKRESDMAQAILSGAEGAHLKDVLKRMPTQPASRSDELLPHHWRPVVLAH